MNMLFSYRDWWHRVSVQKPIKCSKTDFFDETVDPRLWSIFDEVNQQTDQRPIFEEVLVWTTFWDLNVGLLHFAAITFSPLQQKKSAGKIIFSFSPFQKKISALTRRFRNRHCSRCQRFELRHWKLFLHWNSYSWVEKGTKRSYYLEMKIWQANLD